MKKPHADRIAELLQDLRPDSALGRRRPGRPLAQLMQRSRTPAVSLAVIDEFDVAWAGGFGTPRWGDESAVSGETLFQAGSVSKPVFALAVMRLVKDRRIDLDRDVDSYLTSWRIPDNAGWRPRITLRQLLSHSAGTTVNGFRGYPASGPWPSLLEILDGVPPANSQPILVDSLPGLQTRYSGGGLTIAQQVMTDILARPLPVFMRELVLDPLRMTRSTFEQPLPAGLAPCAAVAHPWNGVPVNGGWHVYPEMAAAGLWTTAGDLARLGSELLRILRGDDSVLGLDRDALGEMLRPQLPGHKAGQEFRGLGWRCSGEGDAFQFGHDGWNEGYLSSISLLPARGQGVVVLLNSNQGVPLLGEIDGAVRRHYQWPRAESPPAMVPMSAGVDYAGVYCDPAGFLFRVKQTETGLLLGFGGQADLPLAPASRTEFFASVLDLQARFAVAQNGTATTMTITHGGKVLIATRQVGSSEPPPA